MARPKNGGKARRGRSGGLLLAALAMGAVSLLIWTKLRLVTGIPRTAYAEPPAAWPAEKPALSPLEDEAETAVADGSGLDSGR